MRRRLAVLLIAGVTIGLAAPASGDDPDTKYFIAKTQHRERISFRVADGKVRGGRFDDPKVQCRDGEDGSAVLFFRPAPIRHTHFRRRDDRPGVHSVLAGHVRGDHARGRARLRVNFRGSRCDTGRVRWRAMTVTRARWAQFRDDEVRPQSRVLFQR